MKDCGLGPTSAGAVFWVSPGLGQTSLNLTGLWTPAANPARRESFLGTGHCPPLPWSWEGKLLSISPEGLLKLGVLKEAVVSHDLVLVELSYQGSSFILHMHR